MRTLRGESKVFVARCVSLVVIKVKRRQQMKLQQHLLQHRRKTDAMTTPVRRKRTPTVPSALPQWPCPPLREAKLQCTKILHDAANCAENSTMRPPAPHWATKSTAIAWQHWLSCTMIAGSHLHQTTKRSLPRSEVEALYHNAPRCRQLCRERHHAATGAALGDEVDNFRLATLAIMYNDRWVLCCYT